MNQALYILARTDLDSMNPGKLAAQAAHVGSALDSYVAKMRLKDTTYEATEKYKQYMEWKAHTTQDFGTTIVLGGSMSAISNTIKCFEKLNYIAGIIHDPTYPLRDGMITHLIPLDTMGFVFVSDRLKDELAKTLLSSYGLHP